MLGIFGFMFQFIVVLQICLLRRLDNLFLKLDIFLKLLGLLF